MKNAWKWILGIVLVLVIVATPLLLHSAFGTRFMRGLDERGPRMMERSGWLHPGLERGFRAQMGIRMHDGFGFFGPFAFLGGLVKLAFFGALLYGAYWLGRHNARVVLEPAHVRPAAPTESASIPPREDPKE